MDLEARKGKGKMEEKLSSSSNPKLSSSSDPQVKLSSSSNAQRRVFHCKFCFVAKFADLLDDLPGEASQEICPKKILLLNTCLVQGNADWITRENNITEMRCDCFTNTPLGYFVGQNPPYYVYAEMVAEHPHPAKILEAVVSLDGPSGAEKDMDLIFPSIHLPSKGVTKISEQ